MVDPYLVLPHEILHQIFLPLDVEDRFNCIEVNESWSNFITSDAHLWRSSIVVGTRCDAEILQRCLNYAFGTSSQSIALDTVKIAVSREDSESTLCLLSKGLFNQRVKQIDCLSVEIEDFGDLSEDDEKELQVATDIYLLVPISNFHVIIHGKKMIRLDALLESQAKSLTQLYLYCHSVVGCYQFNRAAPVFIYPMLHELYISFQKISNGGLQSIFGCTNLRLLELANVNERHFPISREHLLNNIPDSLQSLHLAHLNLYDSSQHGNRGWSKKLYSLKLINTYIDHEYGRNIVGSLEGLRELLICSDRSRVFEFCSNSLKRVNRSINHGAIFGSLEGLRRVQQRNPPFEVLDFFNQCKCGSNLRSLSLDEVDEVPDPNLYQNVEHLYLSNVFLGNSFLSESYKLTKVKDVELDGVSNRDAEIVEFLITLAKNNLKTVHLEDHALSPSDIEKISNLGVVVQTGAPVDAESGVGFV